VPSSASSAIETAQTASAARGRAIAQRVTNARLDTAW
jgi:hypothetical protein